MGFLALLGLLVLLRLSKHSSDDIGVRLAAMADPCTYATKDDGVSWALSLALSWVLWISSTDCTPYQTAPWSPDEPRPFRIDAVITWVDADSADWQRSRAHYSPQGDVHTHKQDASDVRFPLRNHSDVELLWSLDALYRNARWLHTVWVVVARPQGRDWFRRYPKVRVVYHDEIWPDEVGLPSFSSRAIETVLHRIPDLAAHYLYFNDDFNMLRPMHPAEFFTQEGTPISFARLGYFSLMPSSADRFFGLDPTYWGGYRVLSELLDKKAVLYPKHAPVALTRALMNRTEHRFSSQFAKIRTHHFRSGDTMPPIAAAINVNELVSERATDSTYMLERECLSLAEHMPVNPETAPTMLTVNNCKTKAEFDIMVQALRQYTIPTNPDLVTCAAACYGGHTPGTCQEIEALLAEGRCADTCTLKEIEDLARVVGLGCDFLNDALAAAVGLGSDASEDFALAVKSIANSPSRSLEVEEGRRRSHTLGITLAVSAGAIALVCIAHAMRSKRRGGAKHGLLRARRISLSPLRRAVGHRTATFRIRSSTSEAARGQSDARSPSRWVQLSEEVA